MEQIHTVIHDESRFQKGTLNMRTQKLFAVKVGNAFVDVIINLDDTFSSFSQTKRENPTVINLFNSCEKVYSVFAR